jgi:hypothetical protein
MEKRLILLSEIEIVVYNYGRYKTPGKRDGLNIMLSKQKGICNFRLRPSVEENLQTCAR